MEHDSDSTSSSSSSASIDVVAAALRRRGRYLMGRRPAGEAAVGADWEFPGGKVEPGETFAAALARELREELGIEVAVGDRLGSTEVALPGRTLILHLLRCELVGGEPEPRFHREIAWLRDEDLATIDLAPADRRLLAFLPA